MREQQLRYARRRAEALPALEARGLVHDGGPSTFYLWLRDSTGDGPSDGWAIAADLATTGLLVAPGDFYGEAGASTCGWPSPSPTTRSTSWSAVSGSRLS